MWFGHYESEVKQPDLNKTKLLNIRRHPSCKDLQLICGWDIIYNIYFVHFLKKVQLFYKHNTIMNKFIQAIYMYMTS